LNFSNAGVELYYQIKHPFNLMQGIKISVEDGNIINSQTITSLTHSKSVSFSLDPSTTSECETSSPVSLCTKALKFTGRVLY
jgi:hypothetical protein